MPCAKVAWTLLNVRVNYMFFIEIRCFSINHSYLRHQDSVLRNILQNMTLRWLASVPPCVLAVIQIYIQETEILRNINISSFLITYVLCHKIFSSKILAMVINIPKKWVINVALFSLHSLISASISYTFWNVWSLNEISLVTWRSDARPFK